MTPDQTTACGTETAGNLDSSNIKYFCVSKEIIKERKRQALDLGKNNEQFFKILSKEIESGSVFQEPGGSQCCSVGGGKAGGWKRGRLALPLSLAVSHQIPSGHKFMSLGIHVCRIKVLLGDCVHN